MKQLSKTKYMTKVKATPVEILQGVDALKAQTTGFLP